MKHNTRLLQKMADCYPPGLIEEHFDLETGVEKFVPLPNPIVLLIGRLALRCQSKNELVKMIDSLDYVKERCTKRIPRTEFLSYPDYARDNMHFGYKSHRKLAEQFRDLIERLINPPIDTDPVREYNTPPIYDPLDREFDFPEDL